jgi:hypothetical protein
MQAANKPNTTQRHYMEHRWGERLPLDLPVRLEMAGALLGEGRLRNASISGAYVATDGGSQVLANVELVVHTAHAPAGRLVLPACVVRRDDGGLGLEWQDMACESVVKLLRELDALAPLWRKDPVFG